MPNQQDIADGVYAKLIEDTSAGSFFGLLGGRVYGGEMPQSVKAPRNPHAVWNLVDVRPLILLANSNSWEGEFQIDLWGDREQGVKALRQINDVLIAMLDRSDIANFVSGFTIVSVLNTSQGAPLVEEDLYRQMSQWRFFAS